MITAHQSEIEKLLKTFTPLELATKVVTLRHAFAISNQASQHRGEALLEENSALRTHLLIQKVKQ